MLKHNKEIVFPIGGIFAVIVTFNGDWKNVSRLVMQLTEDGIGHVVVDNGSSERADLVAFNTIFLNENLGIAAAQNVGIEHGLARGAAIVVFFDQDSVIDAGFISSLVRPIEDNRTKIAAPVFYDIKLGFSYPIVKLSKHGFRTKFRPEQMNGPVVTNVVISSGTAVAADVFSVAGVMNADLFIDYVDTEWCLRCFNKGFSILINPAVRMDHSIGDRTISIGRFKAPIHSPLRRYYRIRNALLLLRVPHVPKILAVREVLFSLAHQMLIITVSKNRFSYLKYMVLGVVHGLTNRSGRLK